MENLTTTPEDAVGIAGFLLSGDQKVFTCRGCGSEYLAESPATGGCPICPLVAELAAVRDEVERVQAYRVIEASSLEDLEVALNSNAAAGYRAVRVDPPHFLRLLRWRRHRPRGHPCPHGLQPRRSRHFAGVG